MSCWWNTSARLQTLCKVLLLYWLDILDTFKCIQNIFVQRDMELTNKDCIIIYNITTTK